VALAESTVVALDEVLASSQKRYVVAQLARAHLQATEALLSQTTETLDPFRAFVAGLFGTSRGRRRRRARLLNELALLRGIAATRDPLWAASSRSRANANISRPPP
jgi:hypothetical protein